MWQTGEPPAWKPLPTEHTWLLTRLWAGLDCGDSWVLEFHHFSTGKQRQDCFTSLQLCISWETRPSVPLIPRWVRHFLRPKRHNSSSQPVRGLLIFLLIVFSPLRVQLLVYPLLGIKPRPSCSMSGEHGEGEASVGGLWQASLFCCFQAPVVQAGFELAV